MEHLLGYCKIRTAPRRQSAGSGRQRRPDWKPAQPGPRTVNTAALAVQRAQEETNYAFPVGRGPGFCSFFIFIMIDE